MPVCSDELIALAGALLDSEAGEAPIRASIGRGYYALYHEAMSVAGKLSLPDQPARGGVHEALIAKYQAKGKRLACIARQLRQRKLLRVKADYYIGEDITAKEALVHHRQCQDLIAELRRIASAQD